MMRSACCLLLAVVAPSAGFSVPPATVARIAVGGAAALVAGPQVATSAAVAGSAAAILHAAWEQQHKPLPPDAHADVTAPSDANTADALQPAVIAPTFNWEDEPLCSSWL